MRLIALYHATEITCTACGGTCYPRKSVVYSDLDAVPFRKNYHAECLTDEQVIEGLRRQQDALDASAAAYYRAHEGRYQGD